MAEERLAIIQDVRMEEGLVVIGDRPDDEAEDLISLHDQDYMLPVNNTEATPYKSLWEVQRYVLITADYYYHNTYTFNETTTDLSETLSNINRH